MTKKWLIGFVLLSVLLHIDVWAQKKGKGTIVKDDYIYKIDKKELQVQNLYIEALNEKMLGNIEDAVGLFHAVLKLDPNNHAAYYELSRMAYEANKLDEAEQFAAKAIKLNPKNEWYHIYYAEAKAHRGDYIGAAKAYEAIIDEMPELTEYYQDVAYMYAKADKSEEAIEVYDKIEKMQGISEPLSLQKQSLYIKLGKIDKAANEIKNLIDQFPDNDNYYILMAEIFEANDMHKKAQETYEWLLERKPDNPQALLAIAEIQRKMGNEEEYKATIRKVFESKSLDINTKIFMFIPYIEEVASKPESAEEVLEMAEMIKNTHPDDAKAATAYADVLYNIDRKEEAIEAYKKAAAFEESPLTVWLQLFDLFVREKDYPSLLEFADKGAEKFPDDATPYFYSGAACAQMKDYQCAAEKYETALKMDIPNPQAVAQILSSLGDAYNELGNYVKSDSCYDEVLVINPNDAYTLNNYAYYLSLRNENLEKAEKMSKRSNMLVENNSSFLDTYAWILFAEGKYEMAKEWIEKAITNMSKDGEDRPVLLEHYGDILFKLGELENALIQWQKALDAGGDKEILEQKIKNKALIK
ncbi:MAG: tetratricopeptide repeat protein [Chitinophagales bacterium]